jgi:hypothetical protein
MHRQALDQEQAPAHEKLVSLSEFRSCIIERGKASKKTEFPRTVWLHEVDGGLGSDRRVLVVIASDQK